MSRRTRIVIAVAVVAVIATAATLTAARGREGGIEVRLEAVGHRDLVATVTASGNIRARRTVDISADVSGRVVELNVEEGEDVEAGQVLLRIDPTQFRAALARAQGALSQSQAQAAERQANAAQAERELRRFADLWARDSTLVSRQKVEDAETAHEVAQSLLTAAGYQVEQAQATLDEAEDRLSKTIIRAPISGKVTRLSIELGETAIVGTMNNPGSLLLTISDLSVIEAVMEVDETDIPEIALGDSALVELDAFPDRVFRGIVTEIGNSAIRPPASTAGTGQTPTIDFEVVITLEDPPAQLRTDLSATADIITETRTGALAIPIIALTVRDADEVLSTEGDDENAPERPEGPVARSMQQRSEEGVFLVREGSVTFTPVEVGIAGQEYFEVLSGLSAGDTVVAGPYQRIRALEDGDEVRAEEQEGDEGRGPGGGT